MKSITITAFGHANWKYLLKALNRALQREVIASAQVKLSYHAQEQCQLSVSLYPANYLSRPLSKSCPFCTKRVQLPECNSQSILAQAKRKGGRQPEVAEFREASVKEGGAFF